MAMEISKEEIDRLLERPTVTAKQTAQILGGSRNPTYDAIRNGEIPSIRIGRRIMVPTAWLRRMLQVGEAA